MRSFKYFLAFLLLFPDVSLGAVHKFDLLYGNRGDFDNIRFDGNTISTTNANGDLTLSPNGTGSVIAPTLTLDGQASTPSNPSAGYYKLYVKDDGKAYKLDSSGTEEEIGSGAGGGSGTNDKREYILDGDFEDTDAVTSSWSTYDDAAAAPVDGSGGTVTATFQRISATTFIRQTAAAQFSKDAANRQGEGFCTDITLDHADYQAGKAVEVSFEYVTSSNYASGDVLMYAINTSTNSVQAIQTLQSTTAGTVLASSTQTRWVGIFYPTDTTNAGYRICGHIATTNASAWTMTVDSFHAGNMTTVPGAIVSEWVSFTPSSLAGGGFGTVTSFTGRWRRVGDSMEIQQQFTSGTVAASRGNFFIPDGYTVDTNKVSNLTVLGGTGNAGNFDSPQIVFWSSSDSRPALGIGNNALGVGTLDSVAVNSFFGNGTGISARFTVPISGWSASAAISTTETMLRSARARYTTAAGQAIADNTITIINYGTVDYDSHSAVTTGASWKFTAPASSMYQVSFGNAFGSTAANQLYYIYKNGSLYQRISQNVATENNQMGGSAAIYLAKGDYFDIRVWHATGASRSLDTTATNNWVTVVAVPDFSLFSVYGVSEYQESVGAGSAVNWPFTASNYGDVTSISLTPGEWDISAMLHTYNNGAVTAGNLHVGISTASGHTTAGIVFGSNMLNQYNAGASAMYTHVAVPNYRVVVTTTTTYYLKAAYMNTITNLQHVGYRLSARRIK